MYMRQADSKRKDTVAARSRAAQESKKAADATAKANDEERRAADARSREQRAQQRKADEQQRREARARERQDAARDVQIGELAQRTRHVEAALASARLVAPRHITILFLAGNPRTLGEHDLRLDREVREIDDNVLRTQFRDAIRFVPHVATRIRDVTEALNRHRPDIVHFSGHGSESGLVFDDNHGNPHDVDFSQFGLLLQVATKPVRLVVFNACDSAQQAELACDFVDAAIGMNTSIQDDDAKEFAGAFYNSLGYANSIRTAFDQAVAHVIAERGALSGKPQLHVADGCYADEMVLVAPYTASVGQSA